MSFIILYFLKSEHTTHWTPHYVPVCSSYATCADLYMLNKLLLSFTTKVTLVLLHNFFCQFTSQTCFAFCWQFPSSQGRPSALPFLKINSVKPFFFPVYQSEHLVCFCFSLCPVITARSDRSKHELICLPVRCVHGLSRLFDIQDFFEAAAKKTNFCHGSSFQMQILRKFPQKSQSPTIGAQQLDIAYK